MTQVFEGEKRFDLVVRRKEAYRSDVQRLPEILIARPDAGQVPLGWVRLLTRIVRPPMILLAGRWFPVGETSPPREQFVAEPAGAGGSHE